MILRSRSITVGGVAAWLVSRIESDGPSKEVATYFAVQKLATRSIIADRSREGETYPIPQVPVPAGLLAIVGEALDEV